MAFRVGGVAEAEEEPVTAVGDKPNSPCLLATISTFVIGAVSNIFFSSLSNFCLSTAAGALFLGSGLLLERFKT